MYGTEQERRGCVLPVDSGHKSSGLFHSVHDCIDGVPVDTSGGFL